MQILFLKHPKQPVRYHGRCDSSLYHPAPTSLALSDPTWDLSWHRLRAFRSWRDGMGRGPSSAQLAQQHGVMSCQGGSGISSTAAAGSQCPLSTEPQPKISANLQFELTPRVVEANHCSVSHHSPHPGMLIYLLTFVSFMRPSEYSNSCQQEVPSAHVLRHRRRPCARDNAASTPRANTYSTVTDRLAFNMAVCGIKPASSQRERYLSENWTCGGTQDRRKHKCVRPV